MAKDYTSMSAGQLEELRTLVLARIAQVPAFRRGSLQVGYRKCGKSSCRCARPGEQGHGPRGLWTRTARGVGGSRGQYIPVDSIEQVRGELDNYAEFAALVEDYVEINEALCKATMAPPGPALKRSVPAATGGQKGGSPARGRTAGKR